MDDGDHCGERVLRRRCLTATDLVTAALVSVDQRTLHADLDHLGAAIDRVL
jgi:hypothetical protein